MLRTFNFVNLVFKNELLTEIIILIIIIIMTLVMDFTIFTCDPENSPFACHQARAVP
jgi:hypothetical protein